MTWYVVRDGGVSYPDDPDRPIDERRVWTLSRSPNETGWETDGGYNGYGLTKADAEELANAAKVRDEWCAEYVRVRNELEALKEARIVDRAAMRELTG